MGRGGTEDCPNELNYALSSDLVYHEYSHFVVEEITHLPNITGSEAAAMGEGLADYFATSMNNDSVWGDVVSPDRTRNLDNTLKYKYFDEFGIEYTDMIGQAHHDGQIFAGALWDLRKSIGQETADRLVFNTLYQDRLHYETYMYGMIIEDDDNNDFSDGTPHLIQILEAFENHGIGPGVLNFEGLPINPEDWTKLLEEAGYTGEEEPLLFAHDDADCADNFCCITGGTSPNTYIRTANNGSATTCRITSSETWDYVYTYTGDTMILGSETGAATTLTVNSDVSVQGGTLTIGSSTTADYSTSLSVGGNLTISSNGLVYTRGNTQTSPSVVNNTLYVTGTTNVGSNTSNLGELRFVDNNTLSTSGNVYVYGTLHTYVNSQFTVSGTTYAHGSTNSHIDVDSGSTLQTNYLIFGEADASPNGGDLTNDGTVNVVQSLVVQDAGVIDNNTGAVLDVTTSTGLTYSTQFYDACTITNYGTVRMERAMVSSEQVAAGNGPTIANYATWDMSEASPDLNDMYLQADTQFTNYAASGNVLVADDVATSGSADIMNYDLFTIGNLNVSHTSESLLSIGDGTTFTNYTGGSVDASTGSATLFGEILVYGTGVFDNAATVTTDYFTIGDISDGGTFNNNSGGSMQVVSTATNAATIYRGVLNNNNGATLFDVNGSMTISGISGDIGDVINYDNSFVINGSVTVNNYGDLDNRSTGTAQIDGYLTTDGSTSGGGVYNYGTFTVNYSMMMTYGGMFNYGGTFNIGTSGAAPNNDLTMRNNSSVTNQATINIYDDLIMGNEISGGSAVIYNNKNINIVSSSDNIVNMYGTSTSIYNQCNGTNYPVFNVSYTAGGSSTDGIVYVVNGSVIENECTVVGQTATFEAHALYVGQDGGLAGGTFTNKQRGTVFLANTSTSYPTVDIYRGTVTNEAIATNFNSGSGIGKIRINGVLGDKGYFSTSALSRGGVEIKAFGEMTVNNAGDHDGNACYIYGTRISSVNYDGLLTINPLGIFDCTTMYVGTTDPIDPGKVVSYGYAGITTLNVYEDSTPDSQIEFSLPNSAYSQLISTTINLGTTTRTGGTLSNAGYVEATNFTVYEYGAVSNASTGYIYVENLLKLNTDTTINKYLRSYTNNGGTEATNLEINGDNAIMLSTGASAEIYVNNNLTVDEGRLTIDDGTYGTTVDGNTYVYYGGGTTTKGELYNYDSYINAGKMLVTGYVQNGSTTKIANMEIRSTSGTEDLHIFKGNSAVGYGRVLNQGSTLTVGDATGGQIVIEGDDDIVSGPDHYYFAELQNSEGGLGAVGQINANEIYVKHAAYLYNYSDINASDKIWTADLDGSPKYIYNYGTGDIDVTGDGNVWLYDRTYWNGANGSTLDAVGTMKVFGPAAGTTVDNYGHIGTYKLWNGDQPEYIGGIINNNGGGDINVTFDGTDAAQIYDGEINLNSNSTGFDVAGRMTIKGASTGASSYGKIDATDGTYGDRPNSTFGELYILADGTYETEDDVEILNLGLGAAQTGTLNMVGTFSYPAEFTLRPGAPVQPINESKLYIHGPTYVSNYSVLANYSYKNNPASWASGGVIALGTIIVYQYGVIGSDADSSFNLLGGLNTNGSVYMLDDVYATQITQTNGIVQMGHSTNAGITNLPGKLTVSGGTFTSYNHASLETANPDPDGAWHDIEITGASTTATFANDDGSGTLVCTNDIHGYLDILNNATVYMNCDQGGNVHSGSPGGNTQVEGTLILNTTLTTETMVVGDGVSASGKVTHDTVTSSGAESTTFILWVTDTLTVNSNGEMTVDGKANFYGTGGSNNRGGSYGGIGQYSGTSGSPYNQYGYMGVPDEQFGRCGVTDPSGPVCQGDGGGRMSIFVGDFFGGTHTGELILNSGGTISANGGSAAAGGGSGGNIIIGLANTMSGSGIIRANGGNSTGGTFDTAGGGGRIFILHYAENTFKPGVADFTGTISAIGGQGSINSLYGGTGTITKWWTNAWGNQNDGTIYVDAFGNLPDLNGDSTTNSTDQTVIGMPSPGVESVQAENNAWVNILAGSFLQQCVKDGTSNVSIGSPGAFMNRDHTPVLTTSCLFSPDPPRDLHINNSSTGAGTEYEGEYDDTQPHVVDLTPATTAMYYDARLDSDDANLTPTQDAIKYQIQISTNLSDLYTGNNGGSIVTNCDLDDLAIPSPGYVTANNRTMDIIIPEACGNNLTVNTDYYWRIRLMENTPGGGSDYWGLWSETNTFKIDEGGTIEVDTCNVGGTQFSLGTFNTESSNPLTRNFYSDYCTFDTDATVTIYMKTNKGDYLAHTTTGEEIWDMQTSDDDPISGMDGKNRTGAQELNEVGFYIDPASYDPLEFTPGTSFAGPDYDEAYTYLPTRPTSLTILTSSGGYSNKTFIMNIGAFIHALINPADPRSDEPTAYCSLTQTYPCITKPGDYSSIVNITASTAP